MASNEELRANTKPGVAKTLMILTDYKKVVQNSTKTILSCALIEYSSNFNCGGNIYLSFTQ